MKSGNVIRKFLKEKGIKNCWLAKKLGISNSTLNSYLNSDMKISNTVRVCEALNISLDEFFERYKEER